MAGDDSSAIRPVAEDDDAAVESFHRRIGFPLRADYWARAWGEGCPPACASTPWALFGPSGEVRAFAAARPCRWSVGGEPRDAFVLHDAAAASQGDGAALLRRFAGCGRIVLLGGLGPQGIAAAEEAGFYAVGYFGRWRLRPREAAAVVPAAPPLQFERSVRLPALPEDDPADHALARSVHRLRPSEERRWLLERSPAGAEIHIALADDQSIACAALRERQSPKGPELHLVDFHALPSDGDAFVAGLAALCAARARPLYASMMGDHWASAFATHGFTLESPRWLLLAAAPADDSLTVASLLRRESWFASPLDLELDGW